MKAILCTEFGGPDVLRLAEIEPPVLPPGGVRIGVRAAGVNFADTLVITGKYQVKPAFPFSPGLEVAGTVLECAGGVTRCRPGDRVMAALNYGGYAEQAIAMEHDVFPLPGDMEFDVAAGFPVAYGTSHVALSLRAGLSPGEILVVHGAAGGVGLTAVEIGKAMGAEVIATAGGQAKLQVAAEHGADHLIDYRAEDVRERVNAITDGRGADVVYDAVGGDAFDASLRSIAWNGRILIIGFAGGKIPQIPANILMVKNIAAIGVHWGSYRTHQPDRLADSFAQLFQWYSQGHLRPLVSATVPLEEAGQALQELLARKSTGKVVLSI